MLRLKVSLVIIVLVYLTLSFGTSMGAPISYNETADGDLPTPIEPHTASDFLAVDVGINTFIGTSTWSVDESADFDHALISISSDLQLTEVTFSCSVYNSDISQLTQLDLSHLEWNLSDPNDVVGLSMEYIDSFPFTGTLFTSDLPLAGLGRHGFGFQGFHRTGPGQPITIDYTWELEVISAPIPEPATVILLSTGLFGLAILGRKRFLKN